MSMIVFPDGAPWLDPDDPLAFAFDQTVSDYTLEEISRLRLRDPGGGDHPVATLGSRARHGRRPVVDAPGAQELAGGKPRRRYSKGTTQTTSCSGAKGIAVNWRIPPVPWGSVLPTIFRPHPILEPGWTRRWTFMAHCSSLRVGSQALTPELVSTIGARGLRVDVDTRSVFPWNQTALWRRGCKLR